MPNPQRIFLSLLLFATAARLLPSGAERAAEERLSFQTNGPWSPRTNLNADVAMVYGIGQRMPANIETWRQHGYTIHVMTGVAWGQYQDYLNGRFDGQNHWDQAQTQADGKLILHGGNRDIPYISPGENYGKYLTLGVKRALDAGAQAIHLEEPEFWARGGWEENFKREWKAYYKEDWQAPNSSPDAQYRASKLKYYLYRRALSQIFDFAKEYGKANNRTIRCYVPTHSLINYAHWRIVSPESSLIDVGADGYIAQVWTGTARTANLYEGPPQGADVRNRVSRIRRHAEPGARVRPAGVVSERPDRRRSQPRLGRLPHQLGEHADRIASPTGSVALRNHAVAGPRLQQPASAQEHSRGTNREGAGAGSRRNRPGRIRARQRECGTGR